MRYDFNLYYADNTGGSSGVVANSGSAGARPLHRKSVIAVFRDQKTIDAVAAAPPIVRLFLEEAGFVAKVTRPDDPAGAPPPTDAAMRRLLVKQLTTVLSNRAMKKALGRVANRGAFNVHDFIASVVVNVTLDTDDGQDKAGSDGKVMPRRPSQVRSTGARRRVRPT